MAKKLLEKPIEFEAAPREPEKKQTNYKLAGVLFILFIAALGGFVWSYGNYQDYRNKVAKLTSPEGQQELAKQETAGLVERVSKLIVLPKDEEPTVATVLDAEGLKRDQPFYNDTKNGHKVLIYVKAQKAIIYDPINNILVNVGPVYIQSADKANAPAPTNQ